MKSFNYRCRKCGRIISLLSNQRLGDVSSIDEHKLASNRFHKHCDDLQEDEEVLIDLVSVSNTELDNAVDILISAKILENTEDKIKTIHLDEFRRLITDNNHIIDPSSQNIDYIHDLCKRHDIVIGGKL